MIFQKRIIFNFHCFLSFRSIKWDHDFFQVLRFIRFDHILIRFNIASILIIYWCDLESVICLDGVFFESYLTVSKDRFEIFLMRENLLDEISEADEKSCSFDDKTDVFCISFSKFSYRSSSCSISSITTSISPTLNAVDVSFRVFWLIETIFLTLFWSLNANSFSSKSFES